MIDFETYRDYTLETAQTILAVDSPSGFTRKAVELTQKLAQDLGYTARITKKGGLVIDVPGQSSEKKIGLCAHLDTLGLMCRSITAQGELKFSKIGGPILPTLDGEYCKVYTRDGRIYIGTILSLSPAAHVHDDARDRARDEDNMMIRLDCPVHTAQDVTDLGIAPGDYIAYDPKTQVTDQGFLKSRFIDDKGCVACLFGVLKALTDQGMKPHFDTEIHLTVYEEVGHGGATFPRDLDEILALDMGCVGLDLQGSEYKVSICAKDAGGPYSYDLVTRLVNLSKAHGADYALDLYPHYSSDVTVAWRAGCDAPAALIGPGVHASHGMERTHWLGLKHTMALTAAYLCD